MKPFVIGVTGPIGCGKSNILRTLIRLGAEGLDADAIAHEVMAPGEPAREAVMAAFGEGLLKPDGSIDRALLGARVFSDPAALARLEAILHPAVVRVIAVRVTASRAPVVAIEAIKLIESGLGRSLCDVVWVAVCSEAEQMARLATSRGMSRGEVQQRMANQMSPAEMMAQADCVIHTDGSLAQTETLVREAWLALGFPLPQAAEK